MDDKILASLIHDLKTKQTSEDEFHSPRAFKVFVTSVRLYNDFEKMAADIGVNLLSTIRTVRLLLNK